jgi:hypothetical protein
MKTELEMMEWFRRSSIVENFSDPSKAEITSEKIVVGEFVNIDKISYERLLHEKIAHINEEKMWR